MIEAERYYRVLDLEPGATAEEVHQGYLDLTWVWHPDRFNGHPRLQQKAHCKLQELNEAHAQLRTRQPIAHKPLRTSSPAPAAPAPQASSVDGLSKPHVTQREPEYRQRVVPTTKPPVRSTRDIGEWLD